MAYTGWLEEAAAIRPCDVREVDGVWCIEVSEEASNTKTENAARLVPVHTALQPELRALVPANQGAPKANLESYARQAWEAERARVQAEPQAPQGDQGQVQQAGDRVSAQHIRDTPKGCRRPRVRHQRVDGPLVEALSTGRYGKKVDARNLFTQVEKLSLPAI